MISTKLLRGSANIISSMYSTTCICHDHRQLQVDNDDRPPDASRCHHQKYFSAS